MLVAGGMGTQTLSEGTPGAQSYGVSEGPRPDEVAVSAKLLFAMVHALLILRLIFISEGQGNSKLNFRSQGDAFKMLH